MLGAGGTDEGFIADCKQLSHSLETVYSEGRCWWWSVISIHRKEWQCTYCRETLYKVIKTNIKANKLNYSHPNPAVLVAHPKTSWPCAWTRANIRIYFEYICMEKTVARHAESQHQKPAHHAIAQVTQANLQWPFTETHIHQTHTNPSQWMTSYLCNSV